MHNQIKLSIIIVNYNVSSFLKLCLHSVIKASNNISSEIIVVDNNSTDDSCKMVSDNFSEVNLIKNKKNVGFAKANNQGVAKANGKYILILNPDTFVAEDTFEKILSFADKKKDLGALGVCLIDGSGNFLPESKRKAPTPKIVLNKIFSIKKNNSSYYSNKLNKNDVGEVEILVGAFMLLKKETYLKVGKFSEDYFMYGEDIDLSYKLLKNGYKNYYFGECKVVHFKGESTKKNMKYLKYFYGAMHIFYKTHFKKNWIINKLVLAGIYIWFALKFFELKTSPNKALIPKNIAYLGDNEQHYKVLKNHYSNINVFKVKEGSLDKFIDTLFFDINYLSFKTIINTMVLLSNKNTKFLFLIKDSNHVFYSDNPNKKEHTFKFLDSDLSF